MNRIGRGGVVPFRMGYQQAAFRSRGDLTAEVFSQLNLGVGSVLHVEDFQHFSSVAVYSHHQFVVILKDLIDPLHVLVIILVHDQAGQIQLRQAAFLQGHLAVFQLCMLDNRFRLAAFTVISIPVQQCVQFVFIAEPAVYIGVAVFFAAFVLVIFLIVRVVFGFRIVLFVFILSAAVQQPLIQREGFRFRVYIRVPQDLMLIAFLDHDVKAVSVREYRLNIEVD